MADPLEQLSDADLQALSKNDLNSMSDEGLRVVAATGNKAPQAAAPKEEPIGHWAIRKGLPLVGTVAGGLAGEGVASIPLAAAGNVAGSEAAGWINHKIYGDEAPTYNSLDDAKRLGGEAATGALAEVGGQAIGAGARMATDAVSSAIGKTTTDAVAPMISKEVETGLLDSSGQPITKTVEEAAPVPTPKPGIGSKIKDFVKDHATDAVVAGAGGVVAGVPGAIAAPIVKRAIAPLVEKPIAATVDGIANVLSKTPQFFGKWAPTLTAAASRGEISLNASVYLLQQQDPEFRQKMMELNSHGSSEN